MLSLLMVFMLGSVVAVLLVLSRCGIIRFSLPKLPSIFKISNYDSYFHFKDKRDNLKKKYEEAKEKATNAKSMAKEEIEEILKEE